MFIIWGKRLRRYKEGYFAEWCPVCRSMQAHQSSRVCLASHVYYISLSEGETVGYEKICLNCKTPNWCDESPKPLVFDKNPDLATLIQQTRPDYQQQFAELIDLHQRAQHQAETLTPPQRLQLLSAPLLALSYKVERHYSGREIKPGNLLVLLISIAMFSVLTSLISGLLPQGEILWSLAASALITIPSAVYLMHRNKQAYLAKHVIPQVLQGIDYLHPGEREIQELLATLAQHQHRLGRLLKSKHLCKTE